jgi:hypothetical protein
MFFRSVGVSGTFVKVCKWRVFPNGITAVATSVLTGMVNYAFTNGVRQHDLFYPNAGFNVGDFDGTIEVVYGSSGIKTATSWNYQFTGTGNTTFHRDPTVFIPITRFGSTALGT